MNRLLLPVIMLGILILTACSNTSTPAGPVEITIDANVMKYQPATLEVMAGQRVKLMFRNLDAMEHDFSIMEIPVETTGPTAEPMAGHDMSRMTSEPQLHMAAMMGQIASMEFTPTKPGTYEFFCTVAGHKDAGMVGTLSVKAP